MLYRKAGGGGERSWERDESFCRQNRADNLLCTQETKGPVRRDFATRTGTGDTHSSYKVLKMEKGPKGKYEAYRNVLMGWLEIPQHQKITSHRRPFSSSQNNYFF